MISLYVWLSQVAVLVVAGLIIYWITGGKKA